jgi:hypothetical protein
MLEAMKQVSPSRWEKFKEHFTMEDLKLIADSYKLYNKYMIMKDVQEKVQNGLIDSYMKWKNDYHDFIKQLDILLDFATDESIQEIQ